MAWRAWRVGLVVFMVATTTTLTLSFRKSKGEATTQAADAPLGFPDAVTLQNGTVKVAVSAQAGRITHFGPADGANLLWITARQKNKPLTAPGREYYNIGGDKVWPLLQALWSRAYGGGEWPPDGIIDGREWSLVEQGERSITLGSPVHPRVGVKIRRQITLHANEPKVIITNRITQVERGLFPVHAWSVSQVKWPAHVLLDMAEDRHPAARVEDFGGEQKVEPLVTQLPELGALRFDVRLGEGGRKVGTIGRWLVGVWEDHVWLQATSFDPSGMYPDATNVQVYYDGNYTELELLSPARHLQPGESLENTVTWWLLPRAQMTDEQIVRKARQLTTTRPHVDPK